jgi:predicted metal-binding membrane protein
MMVAMMLPPQLPWLALLAQRDDGRSSAYTQLLPFLSGYLLIWALFSIAAAAVQLSLSSADLLLGHDGRLPKPLGALLLIAIGLFQLTPWKQACLRHCRTPMGFFLSHWRPGGVGALRMGLQHGLYCLGCCSALMLAGFALGVMHLGLMAGLVLLMSLEQLAPNGARWRRVGAALFLFGSTILLVS